MIDRDVWVAAKKRNQPKTLKNPLYRQAYDMWRSGLSIPEIAERMNIIRATAGRYVYQYELWNQPAYLVRVEYQWRSQPEIVEEVFGACSHERAWEIVRRRFTRRTKILSLGPFDESAAEIDFDTKSLLEGIDAETESLQKRLDELKAKRDRLLKGEL